MTKIKLLISFIALLFCTALLKAQGDSCANAYTLTYVPDPATDGIYQLNNTDVRNIIWYKYQAFSPGNSILISSFYNPSLWKIQNMKVYSGACNSLSLLGLDSLASVSDTVLEVDLDSMVIGQTYYIALTKGSLWPCHNKHKCHPSDAAYYDLRISELPLYVFTPCVTCKDPCDLICNPDFENLTGALNCTYSNMNDACSWTTGHCSPDYFNSGCSAGSGVGTPCNGQGSITPHSGVGYAGIGNCNSGTQVSPQNPAGLPWYECLRTDFPPLTAGVTYKLTFWVSLAGRSAQKANSFGAWFTSAFIVNTVGTNILSSQLPPSVTSLNNISTNNGLCVFNTVGCWYEIALDYTAIGGEKHLYLGVDDPNLSSTTPTGAVCSPSANVWAYYYIDDVSLKVSDILATYTATPSACVNQNANFSATNPVPPGYTYSWNIQGLGVFNQQNVTGQFAAPGVYNYTLTINSPNCPGASTATGSITINPLPNITITSVNVCAGSNGTLNANGGINYLWSTGATTPNITVPPGIYNVTGTDANGCSSVASGTVTATPSFSVTINNPSPVTCASNAVPVQLTANIAPLIAGSVILWSNGANTPQINVNPAVTTGYTVTVTTPAGCSVVATTTITILPNPVISVTSPTAVFCSGSNTPFNLVLNAANSNPAVAGITYNWNPNLTCFN
ncbi:MAG: hypothetical protein ACJ76F_00260, partial [Bacteroidia bacterium]